MTNPDDSASGYEGQDYHSRGLTKREHFAALAMKGLCVRANLSYQGNADRLVQDAVATADALIAALNKETK